MTNETLIAIHEFLESFQAVFDTDWEYSKVMLGIHDATPEQDAALRELGLEGIPVVSPQGTFLAPGVDDEGEDWGNRGLLLARYRRLKDLISK